MPKLSTSSGRSPTLVSASLTAPVSATFELRYDKRNWSKISSFGRGLLEDTCCFPGCDEPAVAMHHACYRDKDGDIAGREIPGVHVFPLCDRHHNHRSDLECAHHDSNWFAGVEPEPRLDACQRRHYYKLLLQGWREKRLALRAKESRSPSPKTESGI